jgi:2-methylcitrate dehydratase PrpD
VLDGDYGFYSLVADDPGAADRLDALLDDLGQKWHLPDAAYKLIPCCHFIHPFVEAVEQLLADGLRPSDIDAVHCYVPAGAAPVIAEPWAHRQAPPSGHDARWSLPYVLAARLVDGEIGNSLFTEPIGGERAEVASRITYEIWDDSGFPARYPARVDARTTDGRVLTATVRDILGGAGRPVSEDAIRAKAEKNLREAGWTAAASAELVEAVLDGPSLDLTALSALLRGAAGAGQR